MACNFNCLQTYLENGPTPGGVNVSNAINIPGGQIAGPQAGAVMSPYASITVFAGGPDEDPVDLTGDNSKTVTIGNLSAPGNDNHAIIKSMQVSAFTDLSASVEIIDEQGGEFDLFFRNIADDIEDGINIAMDFGWIGRTCASGYYHYFLSSLPNPDPESDGEPGAVYGVLETIETSYEDGRIKFVLKTSSLANRMPQTTTAINYGSDDQLMRLVTAIQQMFAQGKPSIKPNDILFMRKGPGGKLVPFNFKNSDGGPLGPNGTWQTNQMNLLDAVRSWLNSLTTDRNKGILTTYNYRTRNPQIIFLEDPTPDLNQNDDDLVNMGTYIVNGGNCLYGMSSILTEDGWKLIQNVVKHKYSGKVRCVDNFGNLTWSSITGWHRSYRNHRKLVKVHLLNSRKHYKNVSGAVFTEDHRLLTHRGYIPINKLTASDKIHSGSMQPSGKIHEALIGTLLGDSYITIASNKLECVHCKEQEQYIKYKAKLLITNARKKDENNFKFSHKATPYIRKMGDIFYKDDKKIISEECLRDFSIVSLAFLFMDDGNMYFGNGRKPRASIATCCFTETEVDLLVNKINSLGISCYKRKDIQRYKERKVQYFRIHFDVASTKNLSTTIAPYIHPSMNYKLLPEDRAAFVALEPKEEPFFDNFRLIHTKNFEKVKQAVYCIAVDKHDNFVTHSGVAHNCSPVISFSPRVEWYPGAGPGDAEGGSYTGNQQTTDPFNLANLNPDTNLTRKLLPKRLVNGQWVASTPGGPLTYIVPPQSDFQWRPPTKATRGLMDAMDAHIKAERLFGNLPIEAELKIQGDPRFVNIQDISNYIALIVVNPYYILGNGSSCEWLAQPACNSAFSSNKWMITGADHQINVGSFETTLHIKLTPEDEGD